MARVAKSVIEERINKAIAARYVDGVPRIVKHLEKEFQTKIYDVGRFISLLKEYIKNMGRSQEILFFERMGFVPKSRRYSKTTVKEGIIFFEKLFMEYSKTLQANNTDAEKEVTTKTYKELDKPTRESERVGRTRRAGKEKSMGESEKPQISPSTKVPALEGHLMEDLLKQVAYLVNKVSVVDNKLMEILKSINNDTLSGREVGSKQTKTSIVDKEDDLDKKKKKYFNELSKIFDKEFERVHFLSMMSLNDSREDLISFIHQIISTISKEEIEKDFAGFSREDILNFFCPQAS